MCQKKKYRYKLVRLCSTIIIMYTNKQYVIRSALIQKLERIYEVTVLCQTIEFWGHSL